MTLRNAASEKERRKWAQGGEIAAGCEKTPVPCLWGARLCTGGVLEEWFFLGCF